MLSEPNISYKPFWGICRPLNSWRTNSPNPIQIYCATIVHYRYILSNLIPYVDAGYKIGSFHMVPKGFGQKKCCKFKEDGIRVLDFFEHNWNDIKHSYNNLSFLEYKEKYFLEEACSRKDLMIDFKDDLDLNLKKMNELTQIIENHNQRIINRLEGNE